MEVGLADFDDCPQTPPIRTSSPGINTFVLYAARSISLGEHNKIQGGDVGVHAIAEQRYGSQVTIGTCSIVDDFYNLYSPTVTLGNDVKLGIMQANSVDDDGVPLQSPVKFPGTTMPAPPLGPRIQPTVERDSTVVPTCEVVTFVSGYYGAVTVLGTLLLNPGHYVFKSLTLTDGARLLAISGGVTIDISDQLIAGRSVRISPAFNRPADRLLICVSGYNTSVSQPAVSFGEKCFVRALLFVPYGTITMADHIHAMGAFAGFDIICGNDVDVKFECGFPAKPQGSHGSQQLMGYYGPHPDPSVAHLIGPVPPDTNLAIGIGLPVRDPQRLQMTIKEVSDPKNPNFRKFLTQSQFTQTHGATDEDFKALRDWTTSNGFSVFAAYSNNLYLGVTATAAQIQSALYVNLVYRQASDGTPFVTVDRDPSLDLSVSILRISGLTDFRVPQRSNVNGTGVGGGTYSASDIRTAYIGSDTEIMKLDGTGQTVGLFELNSYDPNDIAGYDGAQTPKLNPLNVILAAIAAPPIFSSYQMDIETALDIQMVQAIAPGAKV